MPSVLPRLADALRWIAPFLAIGVAADGCSRPDTPPPPPPPSAAKVDQDLVDLAFHACFAGDCERAYAHLAEVATGSPARRTDEYIAIRYRFDADRLLQADAEPDLAKRRAVYLAVADSDLSDSGLRAAAIERIARLGSPGAAREVVVNARADAPSPSAVAAKEAAELRREAESKDPAEQAELRAKLEPRIYAGKASPEDVAMLRTVCKAQKDAACLQKLDRLIVR
jgi:hypothetical protein